MLQSLPFTRHLCLFALLLLACLTAGAAHMVDVAGLEQSGDLSGETLGLRFLRDAPSTLTLAELRSMPEDGFAALRPRDVNQRFQRGDYWLKTSVNNSSKAAVTWVLRHPMPLTDYVDYWVFTNGVRVGHATGGDRTQLSQRHIPF